MDAPAIGIDLGTTNSCVGIFQNGRVEIIANDQGNRTTPSCVAFTADKEILVGEAAKSQSTRNPENTIFNIKRFMGRTFDDNVIRAVMKNCPFRVIDDNNKPKIEVTFNGTPKTYIPEEISSKILEKMKETAETYLGKPVENAVITVPAYFNDSQRGATMDAAKIAGLNVLRIINEPTAAAIAYGLQKEMSNEQKVLIFDLGGGTIDVSILTIDNGVFQVISTFGDTHLGGEDFDDRLFYHFLQEFIRDHHDDLFNDKKARRRLKVECEKAKRILTSATIARIDIDSLKNGIDFHSSITRVRFEELNADLFQKIMECVENAIQNVGNRIDKTQIDHVVLVGGSSRDPKIQKMLRDLFDGKELNKSINPDEAVAYGATALAAILNGSESEVVRDVVLFDVTPLSLGLAVKNRNGPDLKMAKVIERNTLIPAKMTQRFQTSEDNQTNVAIDVHEGEYDFTKDNHLLGKFTLSGIPPAPAGVAKVDVTFEIDVNGVLNVTAVEKSTSNSRQITISYDRGRLSKDEIERMIKDAEECRVLKKKRKAALLAKNSLESYCVDVKSTVEDTDLKNKIDESDKNIILKKCEETIVWLKDSDQSFETEVYELKHEELKTVFDVIISIANYPGKKEDKYYEILNVEKNASLNDIERAFRKVSFKYHPDKCQVDQEVGNMFWLTLTKARQSLIDLVNQRLNQS